MSREQQHWHRAPAESTRQFAESAVFSSTGKGIRAVLEITAYPAGHVEVASSEVSGSPRKRTIKRATYPLMFNDMDEAKDAVDLILDRLAHSHGPLKHEP